MKRAAKKRRAGAARVLALALCLALLFGCSGEGGVTWSSFYSFEDDAAQEAAEAVERRSERDILRVSMPVDSGSWDPASNASHGMQGLMQLCFETPVRLDSSLKPREQLVSWAPSSDGFHWTFTVRNDVYFSDGSALTAQDIVKSLDRIATVGQEGPYGWILDEIAAWAATDEHTLSITSARGGYSTLYAMVFPVMKVREEGYPLGTGPYRLAFYDPGKKLELDAQANWWRETPSLTAVHAVALEDAASSVASTTLGESDPEMATFTLGEIDIARTRSVTASQYREAGVSATQDYMTQGYDALFFNFDRPMMKNVTIRTAIAHAIDRQDLIANIYQGHAIAADVPIAPDSWLHEMRLTGPAYDAMLARQMLEEMDFVDADEDGIFDLKPREFRVYTATNASGTDVSATDVPGEEDPPEGLEEDPETAALLNALLTGETVYNPALLEPLRLLTNYDKDNPVRRDAALRIANQLRAVGLPVEVVSVTLEEIPAALEEGDYDLALMGYQVPLNCDLRFMLSSGYEGEQAGASITRFSDSRSDALLGAVHSARDETAYKSAVAAVADRTLETLPFVGLYFRMHTLATRESLRIPSPVREERPFRNIESWYFVETEE